ncbi:MAG: deoxynucleoside kinase [Anaerolineae bacterium]|jgi:deoxyadenosine/deoxycytidine kinase|nr:deoxynucleoside kinase [Anaerolineae bacterium]
MGKLITIVGNTGVGKTTLTAHLCQAAPFVTGLEQHAGRPFQQAFARDLRRYALSNQVDYLLYRAEQEQIIRQADGMGIQDGGLDQDFHVFTRRFFRQGYLTAEEFALCERLYTLLRALLPPPDVILWMQAPLSVVAERYARRGRALEIATLADLEDIELLLEEWLVTVDSTRIITVDASRDDDCDPDRIAALLKQIQEKE